MMTIIESGVSKLVNYYVGKPNTDVLNPIFVIPIQGTNQIMTN